MNELIKKSESRNLEFKESLSVRDEIGESVSAFSNSCNGKILIGISNSGEIKGVQIGEKTIEQLANYIKQNTDNPIYPDIKVEKIDSKGILIIEVNEADEKPVFFRGKAYKRVGNSNHKLSASEIRKLAKQSTKSYWDEQICKDAGLDDIDEYKVELYVSKKEEARNVKRPEISYEQLLVNICAAKKINGKIKPTNAGILFFCENPQRFFVQSRLRLVKFKGQDVTCPVIDRIDCSGCIWEMIKDAEEFVRKNIRLLSYRTEASFQREDKFEYPIKALREAIINALIHRDYNEPADTRVFIFDDRFEVINPGKFPEGVNPEKPEHKPVNPVLCSLIYDVGWIEKYGSGIYMMKKLSRQFGNKEPYYDFSKIQTKMVFESPIKETTLIEIEDISEKLNERQKTALWYLTEHKKIKREDYVRLCKCSEATAKRDMEELVSKNIIKRVPAGKYTYYILLKYKSTAHFAGHLTGHREIKNSEEDINKK